MSAFGKAFIAGVMIVAPFVAVAEAQPPIRIGASLSQEGDRWPEDLAPRKSRFPTPPWSQR